jgi:hypothetical protein
MTTDSIDIYLVCWRSVFSVRLSITQHYWLTAIHKTYWIPSQLLEKVDPDHKKLLFHGSKLSLTKSKIFSHLYPRSSAPPSAKSNVHFRVPCNLKSFTKPWRSRSLQYEADMTLIIAQRYFKIITFTLPLLHLVFLQSCLQEICCFLECHQACQFRMLFQQVLDAVYCAVCVENRSKPLCKILSFTLICTSWFS